MTSRPGRRRKHDRSARRWRTALLVAAVVLSAATGGVVFALSGHGPSPQRLTGTNGDSPANLLAPEAAIRTQAVDWILNQVTQGTIVSCDTEVCAELDGKNFSSLLPLGPGANDPLGSALVVATATIRDQFGSRLNIYAPAVLASFGTGNARIDIRWVYPEGASVYQANLPAALSARKTADAQLLKNSNIELSAAAKAQLRSGQVDPTLALVLATMAYSYPVNVVDFASESPGGGPASLLRWVDLATTVPAAHLTRTAYVDWMQSFLSGQRAEYRPAWINRVTLHGESVLRIGYGAPSPLS